MAIEKQKSLVGRQATEPGSLGSNPSSIMVYLPFVQYSHLKNRDNKSIPDWYMWSIQNSDYDVVSKEWLLANMRGDWVL